jgi:hypothetical protein
MSKENRNDPEICKIAATQDYRCIRFMKKNSRNTLEICKIIVAQNGIEIKEMIKEMKIYFCKMI